MGVKATPVLSFGELLEREQIVPSLKDHSTRPSKNPSLRVSIDDVGTASPTSQPLPSRAEEHRQRLAGLGEKIGKLAHDIRNPLSSIEWFVSLLGNDDHSPEERQELVAHCIKAVRSLDQLVSNILVESAPLKAARESICLSSLFDDVELLAMYSIQKKGVIIQRCRKGEQITIRGHESLLKQGLLNLLINAIHASESESPIEIHCSKEVRVCGERGRQSSRVGITLRIRDYGCGMSKEEISKMFHPFYSKRKGGTGLGLSIVKHIVHIHHGLIDITSQQGKGTTVDLFFPQQRRMA